MDNCDAQYKPDIYQSKKKEDKIDIIIIRMIIDQEIDHLLETGTQIIKAEEVLDKKL